MINIKDLTSDNPKIKYSCGKEAIAISKTNPIELYPHLDVFMNLLHSENKILTWIAIQVIGNLAKVDRKRKIDQLIPYLITLLNDKSMITASNAIGALTEIASNKPTYQDQILSAFLKVEKAKYYAKGKLSPECRNVALGHVLDCLEKFGKEVCSRQEIQVFIKRQTKNTRLKVQEKAIRLLLNIQHPNKI